MKKALKLKVYIMNIKSILMIPIMIQKIKIFLIKFWKKSNFLMIILFQMMISL